MPLLGLVLCPFTCLFRWPPLCRITEPEVPSLRVPTACPHCVKIPRLKKKSLTSVATSGLPLSMLILSIPSLMFRSILPFSCYCFFLPTSTAVFLGQVRSGHRRSLSPGWAGGSVFGVPCGSVYPPGGSACGHEGGQRPGTNRRLFSVGKALSMYLEVAKRLSSRTR